MSFLPAFIAASFFFIYLNSQEIGFFRGRCRRLQTAQSEEIVRSQQPGELQNIQAAYRLDGKNYLKWSQLVRIVLKGKGKIIHLMGTGPKPGDPRFVAWDEEDSKIMAWLWNSMTLEISDACMFLAKTKDIWDAIQNVLKS